MSSRLIRLLLKLYPESRRDRRCAPPAVAAAGIPPVIPEGCDSLQRVHISPRLGARPVSQVKTAHVEALATSMLNAGRAPKTVRNVLTFLHSVFELAHDRGLVCENPVRRATRPARRRKGDANPDLQFLTVEELDAVIRAIADKIVVRKPRPTRRGKICPGPSPPRTSSAPYCAFWCAPRR